MNNTAYSKRKHMKIMDKLQKKLDEARRQEELKQKMLDTYALRHLVNTIFVTKVLNGKDVGDFE